jgi:hypothetical protein
MMPKWQVYSLGNPERRRDVWCTDVHWMEIPAGFLYRVTTYYVSELGDRQGLVENVATVITARASGRA